MLTPLEQDLLNQWRQVCKDNNRLTQEYLNLSFWDMFNFSKIRKLNIEREASHQKWMILFKLLSEHKVFQKNNEEFIDFLNTSSTKEWQ